MNWESLRFTWCIYLSRAYLLARKQMKSSRSLRWMDWKNLNRSQGDTDVKLRGDCKGKRKLGIL